MGTAIWNVFLKKNNNGDYKAGHVNDGCRVMKNKEGDSWRQGSQLGHEARELVP